MNKIRKRRQKKSMMKKTTLREIRQSFGRFFAILAIVALGVGFFAGLKVTRETMVDTVDTYLTEENFYDLRLVSTLGFEKEDVEAFEKEADVAAAEGAYNADILFTDETGTEGVLKVHSIEDSMNGIQVISGRMPESAEECVVDANRFGTNQIGEKITFSSSNEEDTLDLFTSHTYTIVGIVRSSYYMNFERGTTSLGTGTVSGFMYVPQESFDSDYYTEVFIRFHPCGGIYTDAYDDYMEEKEDEWDTICARQVDRRYQDILQEANDKVSDARQELAEQKEDAEAELADARITLEEADKQIADGQMELEDVRKELAAQQNTLNAQKEQLAEQRSTLETQTATLDQARPILGEAAYTVQAAQLQAGMAQIEQAQAQLDTGQTQLDTATNTLADKEQELTDARQEAEDGWQEYEDSKAEFEGKIVDAEAEIADAEEEIAGIEEPDYFVLDRYTNVGYSCFESDSAIVDGIANVFPIFFFMVAALVCITTMNRMVEEQRGQIGVLKALGYGEATIMSKYVFYSGSAAMAGAILGFLGGTWLFPQVIWQAYGMMYNLSDLTYVFDSGLALISIIVSLLCSVGATLFSCYYELNSVPADLMRPKAPRAGKRILLEYMPAIWGRLKFLHKVSLRNIFRYKRRFFMMIIGISGCTALLVTGLGVRDSVMGLPEDQFGTIQIYDCAVTFRDGQNITEETSFTKETANWSEEYLYLSEQSVNLVSQDKTKAINLIVMDADQENGQLQDFINLHTVKKEAINYPGQNQAVISHKIADTYHLRVGDEILLRDDQMKELTVTISGIFENYVYNYVYINEATYTEQMGEAPDYNAAYLNFGEDVDAHQASAALMKLNSVSAVTVSTDTRERFGSMMNSLNYVVLLVIGSAAFLAFIVLYNLSNINITERIREIATIKVLGFYKKETGSYVFRENLILTGIGGACGLILGTGLHRFVMSQINVDMVAFHVQVRPVSYLLSMVLTFAFAWMINLLMTYKLEKINMAESLKSVD